MNAAAIATSRMMKRMCCHLLGACDPPATGCGEFAEEVDVYEMPVPGMPTVVLVPLGPIVNHAPRRPIEVETPVRETLSRIPGSIENVRRNRNPMAHYSGLWVGVSSDPLCYAAQFDALIRK